MPSSDGSYVSIDSCFRVHDAPACHMGNSISWGPHNVLQVSTRWTVQLYLTQLQTPLQKIIVRRHPLVYQEEKFSYKPVLESKWSLSLVPEVRYPAEARLCVQTGCALVVYRVARHWDYAVHVSKGIGLCLSLKELSDFERKKAAMPTESNNADDNLDNPPPTATPEGSAGERTTKRARGKKTAGDDSEDTDEGDDEDETEDGGDGEGVTIADRIRAARKRKPKKTDLRETEVAVMGFEWASEDLLVVLTSAGVSAISFYNDFSDDMEPQCRALLTPQYFFASDPLYKEGAGVSGLSRIQGTGKGTDLFVVFGPFVLRIFEIRDACVTFVGHVFTPEVNCVPSCACFTVRSRAMKEEQQDDDERHTAESVSRPMLVTGAVATPLQLFTGCFSLTTSASSSSSSAGSEKYTSSQEGKKKVSIVHATWSTQAVHQLSVEVGDTFLRGLFPLHYACLDSSFPSPQAPASTFSANVKTESSADTLSCDADQKGTSHASPPPLHVVIGLSNRGIYAFLEGGARITLFACPLVMHSFDMPENRVPGVGGFALHPSLSMGLCLFFNCQKNGMTTRLAPALLLPISPFSYKDPFHQVMALSDVIPHSRDPAQVSLHLWNKQSSLSCFIWEHLFERNARSTSLFRYNVGRNAYWSAPKKELRLRGAGEEDGEETKQYCCPLSIVSQMASTDVRYHFRRLYLDLREHHGVDLFLRWRSPCTSQEHEELLWRQDAALHKKWWYLLGMTLRRCPYDPFIRTELVLANAILVLSKACQYLNLRLEKGEALWSPTSSAAPGIVSYCAEGALGFVHAYMNEMAEHVKEAAGDTARLPWPYSDKWHSALSAFLSALATSKTGALRLDAAPHRFPCSVCAVADGAEVTTSLFFIAKHQMRASVEETHTTAFSGKTFVPIDVFAQDFVVTRCSLCGLCDYASGSLCSVCGGLLT